MDARFSRRRFLATAAVAAGAGALGASACSHGGSTNHIGGVIHVGGPQDASGLSLELTSGAVDGPGQQELSVFEAGIAQRVAFVLAGKSGFLSPAASQVTLQFGPDEHHFGPHVDLQVHSDTGGQAATYGVATYQWPSAGTFWVRSTYGGQTADSPVIVIDRGQAKIPYAGQKMISVATPTFADARGVSPICTRYPVCPFHAQSLDAYLKEDRPLALVFATPALCETATCGPVLDTVVDVSPQFSSKIDFVHCEIFAGLSRNDANTAAVGAYHLQSEPLMFLADRTGTVVERVDGLFGRAELAAALTRLAIL